MNKKICVVDRPLSYISIDIEYTPLLNDMFRYFNHDVTAWLLEGFEDIKEPVLKTIIPYALDYFDYCEPSDFHLTQPYAPAM